MRSRSRLFLCATLAALPLIGAADPWKDESGNGRGRDFERREFKEEYWDGNCKVERKLERNGEYKEERKCRPAGSVYYQPAPVYVPPGPPIEVQPGITIHGTIRIPQ